MEKIKEFQNLIEEALDTYDYLQLYYSKPFKTRPNSDIPIGGGRIESSKEILQAATELQQHYTYKFINEIDNPKGRKVLFDTEIHAIKKLLLLPKFSCFTIDNKRLDFLIEDLKDDLANGRIYGNEMNVCLPVYLGKCWYLDWLIGESKDIQDEIEENPTNYHMKWNGKKNCLADIFYQLKHMNNSEGKPLLDASDIQLARFLKANFECFKNTQVNTIEKSYFVKQDLRPKKSDSKITLIPGFPEN